MGGLERQLPHDVESEIAKIVRTYIDAARSDDSSQDQEALRWLCSGLERLLALQLEGRDGWKGGGLTASFLRRTCFRTPSPDRADFRGR
jgi:hypothetical protein